MLTNNSCLNDSGPSKITEVPYFKVGEFLAGQIVTLNETQLIVTKKATLDQEIEIIELKEVNWKNELAVFKNLDINKAAWYESYTIDTSYVLSNSIITYSAIDENLAVRQLVVHIDSVSNFVSQISGKVIKDNWIHNSTIEMQYLLNTDGSLKSYNITGDQRVLFLKKRTYEIEVTVQ